MPQLQLPATTTRHQYVQLGGGLDQLTPVLQLKPGAVRDSLNWEQSITGGYTRIDGYERFDGTAAPSDSLYFTVTITQTAPISVGATVNGQTSGATGKVLSITVVGSESVVAYTMQTGSFVPGENLRVVAAVVGTNVQPGGGGTARDYDVTQRALAANVYRALILQVPGAGPLRGGFFYKGLVYVFRDNVGQTQLRLHKSSAGGWVSVAIPSMLPGGRIQTDLGNFAGVVKVYGCDGVNKGWEFDGTTLVLITTGNAPDVPDNVLVHKDHLWFSFGTNLQNSGIATPLTWTALSGSVSYRCQSNITALTRQPGSQAGGAMSVSTETGTEMIYGSSALDFQKVAFEESAGARLYGVQRLGGQTLVFGDIGVYNLAATQAYGNFTPASMTMKIRPFTQTRRTQCTASLVNKEKSQYRVFFADGYGLYVTVLNGKLVGSMPVYFPNPVTVAWQGESDDGLEASYIGGADGYVYRLDAGTSADGAEIQSFMTLPFNNQQAARTLKRYRRGTFEIQGDTYAEFSMTYEVNYGGGDRPQGSTATPATLDLGSTNWDDPGVTWDTPVTWDGKTLLPDTLELIGTGENIAIRIDCNSAKFTSFTMNSIVLDYTPRREMRV